MTVSISRMNIEYYLSSTAKGDGNFSEVKDLTSYYLEAGAPAGRWFGAGLQGISMNAGDQVEKRHARKLFDELVDPLTGVALGRRPMKTQQTPTGATTPKGQQAKAKREAVAGFDLTFSVPKSVSVFWALADPATQGRLYAAHQTAIEQTLAWLEAEVVQARSGHGGVAHVDVQGLVGTSFDHWESRAGDPQLHTHAVIANRVQRKEDGQWVTLDSYTLHRHVVAASEMYNGLLFDEVQRRTGAVAEQRGGQIQVTLPSVDSTNADIVTVDETAESRFRVELAGIPDELLHEFSTRSVAVELEKEKLIAEFLEKYGRSPDTEEIIKLRQQATLSTRTAKSKESVPLHRQMFLWKERAHAEGFDISKVVSDALSGEATVIEAATLPQLAVDQIAGYVLQEVATNRPSFAKANLVAATNRLLMTVRCHTPQTRLALVDRITETAIASAVQLSPHRMGTPAQSESNLVRNGHSIFDQPGSWLYSTQHLLDMENMLRAAATTESGPTLSDAEGVQEHLAEVEVGDGHHLAADQARAAHEVLTSTRQINAIIGPAGTGKTTTMRGIHSAWTNQFGAGSVVGLAPSAVAASVLSEEVGMVTENVAKWLHESVGPGAETRTAKYGQTQARLDALNTRLAQEPKNANLVRSIAQVHAKMTSLLAEQAKYTIRPDQLLIVDEASMASTGDLASLTAQVQAAGAKLLLVGDPAQLEAVEAGGFLGWMERAEYSSSLSSVWRFKNDWEAAASLQLRKGMPDEGKPEVFDIYRQNDRITECEPGGGHEAAYSQWLTATTSEEPVETILIGADNESVLDLNTRAQKDLLSLGIVTESPTPAKLRSNQAHIGDVLLARKNDRRIMDDSGSFIKNGTRVTITDIQRDGSIVGTRTDTHERILIPREYLRESTELGYAVTAHRSQGVTVDKAYFAVKEGLGRELLYVGMTRGKHLNQLFVETPENSESHAPDVWGMYKIEERTTADEVLLGILANSTAVKLATEEQDAAHGAANDVGRLVSEYDHLNTAISTRQLGEWVTGAYGTDTLRDLQRNPDWRKLVRAWVPGQAPNDEVPAQLPEILEAIKQQPTSSPKTFEQLLTKAQPVTPEEVRIAGLLEQKISTRLNYLEAVAKDEKPTWIKEVESGVSGTPNPKLLRATLLWRELADQQEATFAAGEPDQSHTRLKDQWNQLKKVQISALTGHPFQEYTESVPDIATAEPVWDEPDYGLDPNEFDMDWPDDWDRRITSDPMEPAPSSVDPGGLVIPLLE